MPNGVREFTSDDSVYLRWLDKTPTGFVVNCRRRISPRYMVLHRATCTHLRGYNRSQKPGAYTERDYIKICARNVVSLRAWGRTHGRLDGTFSSTCLDCRPPDVEPAVLRDPVVLAEEVPETECFEGAKTQVTVNAYERDQRARRLCIQHYGFACQVCGLEFENKYGALGSGFIHVHHLVPVAKVNKRYKVDPIKDLRPVCPNCHAMLHREEPLRSVEQLASIVKANL